ncbi:MAG: hypothetical protein HF978_04880 [Desulfobacteraceae bacterium]|nr:hypothetical protein [Desulfobacteraceae bacterium]MBC2754864.1 hypothetical protein [Desulfobacteraceae bacterium]
MNVKMEIFKLALPLILFLIPFHIYSTILSFLNGGILDLTGYISPEKAKTIAADYAKFCFIPILRLLPIYLSTDNGQTNL